MYSRMLFSPALSECLRSKSCVNGKSPKQWSKDRMVSVYRTIMELSKANVLFASYAPPPTHMSSEGGDKLRLPNKFFLRGCTCSLESKSVDIACLAPFTMSMGLPEQVSASSTIELTMKTLLTRKL